MHDHKPVIEGQEVETHSEWWVNEGGQYRDQKGTPKKEHPKVAATRAEHAVNHEGRTGKHQREKKGDACAVLSVGKRFHIKF